MSTRFTLILPILSGLLILSACSAAPASPSQDADAPPASPAVTVPAETGGAAGGAPTALPPSQEPIQAAEAPPVDEITALMNTFTAPITAPGDLVIVYGRVLDVNGEPLQGVSVEIWQTDARGVYDHPGFQGGGGTDPAFQYYGTSITDANGLYSFRTVKPGSEGIGRPPHIHVKVRVDGIDVLTTQFFFAEDGDEQGADAIFRNAGPEVQNLILQGEQVTGEDGSQVRVAASELVIDTGAGTGALALTPVLTEGPFYPVVRVADYDNDLAAAGG